MEMAQQWTSNLRTTADLAVTNPARPGSSVASKTTISKDADFRAMVFELVTRVRSGQSSLIEDILADCDIVASWILMTDGYNEILQDPPVCAGSGVKVEVG